MAPSCHRSELGLMSPRPLAGLGLAPCLWCADTAVMVCSYVFYEKACGLRRDKAGSTGLPVPMAKKRNRLRVLSSDIHL